MSENGYKGENNQANLDAISTYIRNLKLKSVPFGGVDKASALDAIRDIYRMFVQVRDGMSMQLDGLAAQIGSQKEAETALRGENSSLEKKIEDLTRDNVSLSQTIKQQLENADKAAALEKSFRQREADSLDQIDALRKKIQGLESEMASLKDKHQRELEAAKAGAADKGEMLEDIYLDARRSRTEMLEAAKKAAEEMLRVAQEEIAQREEASALGICEREAESAEGIAQREDISAREIAEREQQTDAAIIARQELLEKTVAEREELLERTVAEREELLEQSIAQREAEAQREFADKQAEADALIAEAQAEADRIRRQYEADENSAKERIAETEVIAKQKIDKANDEAHRIIGEAKAAYQVERKRYDELLMQLGTLRAQTVQAIRNDIANLNGLMFDMTSRGIETDTFNTTNLSNIDDTEITLKDEGNNE